VRRSHRVLQPWCCLTRRIPGRTSRKLADMAPAGRYLVLAIFVAACFVQANCMADPSSTDEETLFFRESSEDDDAMTSDLMEEDAPFVGPIDDTTFQGCFVGCLGRDYCCSCKESRKMSMNAAIVNDLSKDCATSDMKTCASSWVQTAFSDYRGGASQCTDLDSARAKLLTCAESCDGRPLAKPLDPLDLSSDPVPLDDLADIINYSPVTFNDFCSDIRAESYLCNNLRAEAYTAGNSPCRKGNVCGYHSGKTYKWCYTDKSNHWDYCCTGACDYQGQSYQWCYTGGKNWQYCGNPGQTTVKNSQCMTGYPCGLHLDKNKDVSYYWCYTDYNKNWGYCCQPADTCSKKGENYNWCYVGYKKKSNWKYCNK